MYIMKFSFKIAMAVLAVFFILFLTMGSCTHYTPYSFSSASNLPQYPYEGFSSYTTFPDNKTIDSNDNQLITPQSGSNASKIRGFDGLLISPDAPEMQIDTYSQALGENTCKSYGLMNSRGYLCLNPEQVRQLTSRGGNMSSGEASIG